MRSWRPFKCQVLWVLPPDNFIEHQPGKSVSVSRSRHLGCTCETHEFWRPARRAIKDDYAGQVHIALVVDDVDVLVDDVLPEVLGLLLLCVLPPLLRRRARTGRRPRPLPARQPRRLPRRVPRRVHAAPGRTLVGGVVLMTTWRNLMIIPSHRRRGGCAYPAATPSPRRCPRPSGNSYRYH